MGEKKNGKKKKKEKEKKRDTGVRKGYRINRMTERTGNGKNSEAYRDSS